MAMSEGGRHREVAARARAAGDVAGDVLRRRALRAAAQGFFVFPVQRGGKTPAVPRKTSWDELATRDRDQINTWWPDGAGLNIGISTGRSGLLVVDLDHGKGVPPPPRWQGATHGRDVLARLAAEAGEPFPDHTLAVTTSTGGLHLYFRAPENPVLRNTAGTLGWCIDTRGKGGYIVGAGSVRGGRAYTVTHRAPIAALPDWLRAALTPRVPAPRTSPHLPVGDSRAERYLAAIVEGETTRVTNAVVHSRNHTLFIAALKLGSLVGAGELGEATAEDSLLAAASRHFGVEDFHDNEARKTIASGIQLGKQSPRHLREPGQVSR